MPSSSRPLASASSGASFHSVACRMMLRQCETMRPHACRAWDVMEYTGSQPRMYREAASSEQGRSFPCLGSQPRVHAVAGRASSQRWYEELVRKTSSRPSAGLEIVKTAIGSCSRKLRRRG